MSASAHRKAGESIGFYDQCKSLTEGTCEFADFNATAFRSVLNRLDHSFKRFFAHGGFPRFKGRNRGIRSFEVFRIRLRATPSTSRDSGFVVRDVPEGTARPCCTNAHQSKVAIRHRPSVDTGRHDRRPWPGHIPANLCLVMTIRAESACNAGVKQEGKQRKGQKATRWRERLAERQRNAIHRITTGLVR